MKFTPTQYAQALYEALHAAKDADHDKILDNFARLLQGNGDLGRFGEIEEAFAAYERKAKGIKTADVTSARKLSGTEEEHIIKELNDYLGSEVELKKKIDEDVLGGVIIEVEDKLIDGSIKRNLQELKNNLIY